jgi:hypothetical protein
MSGEARRARRRLWREVRSNIAAYARNCQRLRWALQYYTSDEPAVLLPDWDWSWPPDLEMEAPCDRMYRRAGWRRCVDTDLANDIDRLYQLLREQPPEMATWAEEYLADVPLLAFLLDRLDRLQTTVCDLAAGIENALQDHVDKLLQHRRT